MKYEYQTIEYNDNLPARIELFDSRGSGFRRGFHWHKEIELIYVLEGEISVTKNSEATALGSGDLILINSREIHSVSVDDGDNGLKVLSVYLSFDFAKKFDDSLDLMRFQIESDTKAEAFLKEMMKQLAHIKANSDDDFTNVKQYALIMEIFHILLTNCRKQKQISLYGNCKVEFRNAKLAMEYIEEHYREELNLKILAELVGLNPIYFSKYFKDATGKSFTAYVNAVRIKHAMDDLLNHGMSIADAAQYNGFPSVKSFETVCKRCYGLTPLQFKKQQLRLS